MSEQEHKASENDGLTLLELEKRGLECAKLRAEIAEVSLAWWKRPTYVGSMVTLAALLTGWLSGYFPAEREKLQKEIANLKTERANYVQEALLVNSDLARLRTEREDFRRQIHELSREAEQTQHTIDDVYLRLKIASSSAAYALGHIRGMEPVSKSEQSMVSAALADLPSNTAKSIQKLLDLYQLAEEIVRMTEEDLNKLPKIIGTIPASKWATELEPMPDGNLYKSDGKHYYHLDDGRFYEGEFPQKRP